jgi:hypothetical protein
MEQITDINFIPVANMRQALEDSGLALMRASLSIGWGKDGKRLRRTLGYETYNGKHATHVEYDVAVKMVRAWRLDPVDYGV